ncbi:MAG: glutamate mutase L [Pseudonocardia sp.]
MSPSRPDAPAVCLDVGSTWTKALLVSSDGRSTAFAQHPTTSADVLSGMDAVAAVVGGSLPAEQPGPAVLACSSAGGALRLAVVGTERLATEEAGHRVACSAGSRVVHVHAGPLEPADVRTLRARQPGAVLLVGGAEGGDASVLLHNAGRLARARVRYPIVLAGNSSAAEDAVALLRATGRKVVTCENVVPRPGTFVPESARAALVELFGGHVAGGRGAPTGARFRRMVRTSTPDAVSRATAELALLWAGGSTVVVDIGSATTAVHSAVGGGAAHRTVEADLGLREAADGVLLAGQVEQLLDPVEADLLSTSVHRMTEDTAFLPVDVGGQAEDRRVGAVAAAVALRRHLERFGDELGAVGLLVLAGGVCRQPDPHALAAVESTLRTDPVLAGVLAGAAVRLDSSFVLPPAGLLADAGGAPPAGTLLREHLLAS